MQFSSARTRVVNRVRASVPLLLLLVSLISSMTAGCASNRAQPIFDGRTLDGWVQRGGRAPYTVEDGCIVGRTAPSQPNSFLCTARTFADFELELDFKVDPALNSGVQVRSESRPDYKNGIVHGYQIEIDPSDRAWTAGLYDESRRAWLVDLRDKPEARAAFRQGEWNRLRVRCVGDRFDTWLNGTPVVTDFHDSLTPDGFIALQVHGVGERRDPLEVRWRNIRVREFSSAHLPAR